MKNTAIALLFIATCMTACQNENTSEVEQKRQELESKRQELKEKQALVALQEEMKTVEAELNKVGKKVPPPSTATPMATSGIIRGENVIMRADCSKESNKITNFINGETVSILYWNKNETDGQIWYQVRRSDQQVGWVFGRFLETI